VVEIIAPMRSEVRETTIVEPTVVTVAGKQVTQNRTVSKQTITRTIAFRDPRYLRLIRTRTLKPMPDIDVTGAAEPWVLFEEAYKTANTP
jgi:hypothetical protein